MEVEREPVCGSSRVPCVEPGGQRSALEDSLSGSQSRLGVANRVVKWRLVPSSRLRARRMISLRVLCSKRASESSLASVSRPTTAEATFWPRRTRQMLVRRADALGPKTFPRRAVIR